MRKAHPGCIISAPRLPLFGADDQTLGVLQLPGSPGDQRKSLHASQKGDPVIQFLPYHEVVHQ